MKTKYLKNHIIAVILGSLASVSNGQKIEVSKGGGRGNTLCKY
jgi:hypothetical protein